MWWWVSPALQHLLFNPGMGQPWWKSPVTAETFMVSCKVWHFLTSEWTLLKSYVNGDKHASWSYNVRNRNEKKEQGQFFVFQDRFRGRLHEAREKRSKWFFDVSFSLHFVPATLWICCLLPFSCLQHFDYQLPKGYHSQILTWHISLFVCLRILNIFCTKLFSFFLNFIRQLH